MTNIGTRNEELNSILAETSQGKSVMMKVAQKVKFNEHVAKFSNAMQVIAGSTLATSLMAGASGLMQSNPLNLSLAGSDGSMIGAGIVLSGLAFIASTEINKFSKNQTQDHNINKMTRENLLKQLKKTIKDDSVKDEHYDTSYLYAKFSPVIAAAEHFTQQVKEINSKNKQKDNIAMAI